MTEISSTKKGFLRRYRDSICAFPFVFLLVIYPNIVMHFNPPPGRAETIALNGVILRAQREHSNVLLQLPSGGVQALDFPGDLQSVYAAMWPHFTKAGPEEFRKLQGCKAEILVDRLNGLVIPSNPRIWSLRCDKYSITYDEMIEYYRRSANNLAAKLITCIGTFALWFAVIAKEFKNRGK